MRIAIAALPLLALAACNVTTDDKNDAVTVQYDENVAANAADDVGNAAQDLGNATANAADKVANKADELKDKADNLSVDVDVKTDGTKATANAQ